MDTDSTGEPTGAVLVRGPGEGPATWAMASLFERLASAAETDGAFGLSLVTQPPGVATPLHIHTREAEAFFLLDGTMTYQAGETSTNSSQVRSSTCRKAYLTLLESPAPPPSASSDSPCRAGS